MPQLISAGNIIKKSWKLYTKNFPLLIKVMLWLILPFILLSLLLIENFKSWASYPSLIITIAILVLAIWINIILVELIKKLHQSELINLKEIYAEGWSKFWSYIWVSILTGLAALGGFILFIIPGIIFAVWFSFAIYFLILENKRGIESLKKSKKLVAGKWWKVLWLWLAPTVVYGLAMFVLIWLIDIIIGALLGNWQMALGQKLIWWAELVSNIVSVSLTPLFASLGIILYLELKKFKTLEVKQQTIKSMVKK